MPYKWETHHCWCSTPTKFAAAPHKDHHEFCKVHTNFFYRAGKSCKLCAEDSERQTVKALKEKYQKQTEEQKRKDESWFTDCSKERKPRAENRKSEKCSLSSKSDDSDDSDKTSS